MFEYIGDEPAQLEPSEFCSHSPDVFCSVCRGLDGKPELDLTMIPLSEEDDDEW